ncbi:MAG: DNA-methyltransferase [Candidatus Kariarchaeaceae archaeon]|jgi:DNA modification methylase
MAQITKYDNFLGTHNNDLILKAMSKLFSEEIQPSVFPTTHKVYFKNSNDMNEIQDKSVQLVCTSPPYCMIEMWDKIFANMNPKIGEALERENGYEAFELMHQELDKTWLEVDRVVTENGIVCINVGDATRKIGSEFQLFSNHTRISSFFMGLGYHVLPSIIWSKQTNKPTKFMGSGMYPGGAYVTLEHEYILIFRKGGKRKYSKKEKQIRQESSYFWEERNKWFSDLWVDLKGTHQELMNLDTRLRSAAYPFELAYRIINMYSIRETDTVLDPFLGTGTTTIASLLLGRNSIGYEFDPKFKKLIKSKLNTAELKLLSESLISHRIKEHEKFQEQRENNNKLLKYDATYYNFRTVSRQETNIKFPWLEIVSQRESSDHIILDCQYTFSPNINSIL